jgi:hypothetical protein
LSTRRLLRNLLDATVIDRKQVRTLAGKELSGRDGAHAVLFGAGFDVTDRIPQPAGRPVLADKVPSFGGLQGYVDRNLGEQPVQLTGPVMQDLQCVIALDPDAQHGDGEQVLGGELAGGFSLVSAPAETVEICARVTSATGGLIEVPLYQAGGEVLVEERGRDVY